MKKWLHMTLALALALSLTACGAETQAPAPTETAPTAPPHIANMINPYLTCESAQEMQEQAGFEISLPTALPDWVTETIYRTIPGELIEVIYAGEDNEIRIRCAMGSVDISGVYDTDQKEEKDVSVGSSTIHLKGETMEDGVFHVCVATWHTEKGRTYSVTSTNGVGEDSALALIAEVE